MSRLSLLKHVEVVLVRPTHPGNMGAVARAMHNMGLSRLVLVAPASDPLGPEARAMAHRSFHLLEAARVVASLGEAVGHCGLVVGTTGKKPRRQPRPVDVRAAAPEILAYGERNRVALVFGPEATGLTTAEMALCHRLVTVPAAPENPSLNLAQAVLLVGYELRRAAQEEGPAPKRALASARELEGFYEHMARVLLEIGFLKPPADAAAFRALRRIFSRADLSAREVRMLRGIFRQVQWALRNR